MQPGKNYENLYRAAAARSEADWYIGLNASRALTTKFNAQLNCGRVQTPTLAIIASMEEEIKNFNAQTFYGIEAKGKDISFTWMDDKGNNRSFDKEKTDAILQKVSGNDATITSVDKKPKKSFAPGLYDLTELQREANKQFGMSAKETLNTMQSLYERHKAVTYPRTDSRYLSQDIIPTIPERLKACGIGEYRAITAKILRNKIKTNHSFVDDKKVSDHHAIIPTENHVHPSDFNERERRIYDMIIKRFLAVFLPPYEYEQMTVRALINAEHFIARGKTVISAGWRAVYSNNFDDEAVDQTLPQLKENSQISIHSINQTDGQTKPPSRFTEASLLSAMENPAKYVEVQDKKLKETLSSTGGLGTVATRADIIDKLFNSFMVEKEGQQIKITSKGKQLLDLVPDELKSPATTAIWEQKLENIEKGKLKKEIFINEMKDHTRNITTQIKNSDKKYKHDNISGKSCPDCGKPMLEVNGKKGKMLVCQDRECGHRKNIAKITNARCPKCKKKMTLSGEGSGRIFTCVCGYKEKMSAFEERKKKEDKGKADKRTVNKYIKEQDKEEPINDTLAEQLKALKLDE